MAVARCVLHDVGCGFWWTGVSLLQRDPFTGWACVAGTMVTPIRLGLVIKHFNHTGRADVLPLVTMLGQFIHMLALFAHHITMVTYTTTRPQWSNS